MYVFNEQNQFFGAGNEMLLMVYITDAWLIQIQLKLMIQIKYICNTIEHQ